MSEDVIEAADTPEEWMAVARKRLLAALGNPTPRELRERWAASEECTDSLLGMADEAGNPIAHEDEPCEHITASIAALKAAGVTMEDCGHCKVVWLRCKACGRFVGVEVEDTL